MAPLIRPFSIQLWSLRVGIVLHPPPTSPHLPPLGPEESRRAGGALPSWAPTVVPWALVIWLLGALAGKFLPLGAPYACLGGCVCFLGKRLRRFLWEAFLGCGRRKVPERYSAGAHDTAQERASRTARAPRTGEVAATGAKLL